MPKSGWKRLDESHEYELNVPPAYINYSNTETTYAPHIRGRLDVQEPGRHGVYSHIRTASSTSPAPKHGSPSLGVPRTKRIIGHTDYWAAAISIVCLILGVAAVANNRLSWFLGVKTYQLVVLGFLLSVMNLCLNTVAPMFFLLLEARFGPSTLQNYDAILRNRMLASRTSFLWRLVLVSMLALPIGLSAAYKSFTGGQSKVEVAASDYVGPVTNYGMYAPPGLQSVGMQTGISLFANATQPFSVDPSTHDDNIDPSRMQDMAFGYNLLLLNNQSTAMLDIPSPEYLKGVQNLLAIGESWYVSADVIGTVASLNTSRASDPDTYDSFALDFCEAADDSSGAYVHMSMLNNNEKALNLASHASPGDQTLQYIAIMHDDGISHSPLCSDFVKAAKLFNIERRQCHGSWSITRSGIQLVGGHCDDTILPSLKQQVIKQANLFLGVWYLPSLVEFLSAFGAAREDSIWQTPYTSAAVAAMLWSRMAVVDNYDNAPDFRNLTSEQAGLVYPVSDSVIYIRPSLRKSPWLFVVIGIQPALIFVLFGLNFLLRATPLDKGFGLISIMAGIDRASLDALGGATLSGKLSKSVKLMMHPVQDDQKGTVGYQVAVPGSTTRLRNGRLASRVMYH